MLSSHIPWIPLASDVVQSRAQEGLYHPWPAKGWNLVQLAISDLSTWPSIMEGIHLIRERHLGV